MVVKKNSLSTNTPFLVRNSCERIPVKSFKEEIRAGNDVKNFIADARVALDVAETDIGKILETALVRVSKLCEIKILIYLHDVIWLGESLE